eukprot:TRINITY_DN21645_c0_g1_i1.p1 TRINITY_DN21645_c0_g1~~TRINITY_DN21645_c0_g1_i1.p1  ORF type:complete len:357 (-),score=101.28 TRINITY_DN21645_c0_g1_i1:77-1147(-)
MLPAELSVEDLQEEVDQLQAWLSLGQAGSSPWPLTSSEGKDGPGFAALQRRRDLEDKFKIPADAAGPGSDLQTLLSQLQEQVVAINGYSEAGLAQVGLHSPRSSRLREDIAIVRQEIADRSHSVANLSARLAAGEAELHMQPSPAHAGAQQDAVQVLQRAASQLQARLPPPQALQAFDGVAQPLHSLQSGEVLQAMQAELGILRDMYITMGQQCDTHHQQLGAERAEAEKYQFEVGQALQKAAEQQRFTAAAERQAYWKAVFTDYATRLGQGEEELQQLRGELVAGQLRRGTVVGEEARLQAAASQDENTLEQLRLQLRGLHARNAGLEVEAKMLGCDTIRRAPGAADQSRMTELE